MNYYNEFDPKTAAWLRELIRAGAIPNGHVDERSISDVSPNDLTGYVQCHFFAGIGGWSYALQLAGWPEDRPIWTGSCPCQPFSTAGKGLGDKDERHLWPTFFNLIRECRPKFVFGEQVASAIGKGWLDGVSADLESEDYACGATVLGAHSVNSPHIRQRLYWMAHAGHLRWRDGTVSIQEEHNEVARPSDGLDNTKRPRLQRLSERGSPDKSDGEEGWLIESTKTSTNDYGMLPPNSNRRQPGSSAATPARYGSSVEPASFWNDFTFAHCRDGKNRRIPTEPAFFPLANGIPARVVRLRGYGNAIVPQVAAEFICASIEVINENSTSIID